MAIVDIKAFAHLSSSDVQAFGEELDAVRRDVEATLGERDSVFIRRSIVLHRALEAAGRVVLIGGRHRGPWLAGTLLLAVAKTIENTLLGHNIGHGQWDWMNDREIHSTTWQWDMVSPSSQWRHAHNFSHHVYTNVYGMDEDLGQGILRMSRDIPWRPLHLLQPINNAILAATFEWGIAIHHWQVHKQLSGTPRWQLNSKANREFIQKIARQVGKDFLVHPLLTGRAFKQTLAANIVASLLRNLWFYVTIFCGHFPDGAEKFTLASLDNEDRAHWYLRQLLGTANFDAGPVMAFLCGGLCYQIEHHLFPDLPCNRYPEIAVRVRAVCEKYDLPYNTGPLARQFWLAFRTVHKLALPDVLLARSADDAPETSSERKFSGVSRPPWRHGPPWQPVDPATGARRGLRTALAARAERRRWQVSFAHQ